MMTSNVTQLAPALKPAKITTELVTLTPELARAWIELNKSNRTVSKNTVQIYANAITRGEWIVNGEPIIFFSNGELGDGQHRCLAVIASGVEIQTMVVYGIDESAFKTIDGGKKRTASDVLGIGGEVNAVRLAAAARAHVAYYAKGRDAYRITSQQIEKCVDEHPELRLWVRKFVAHKLALRSFPGSLCGYLTIASEKYGMQKVEQFMDQLCTGANLTEGSPALILRERLNSQAASKRLSATNIEVYIIKAINAHIAGKPLKWLRYAEAEQFPQIV